MKPLFYNLFHRRCGGQLVEDDSEYGSTYVKLPKVICGQCGKEITGEGQIEDIEDYWRC